MAGNARPRRARRRAGFAAVLALAVCSGVFTGGCSESSEPPIRVQGNLLSVDNRSARDWVDVEIWINRQYRITVPRIAAGSRFTTTLDVFVAGFGQRFDHGRQRIDDLRVTAREPDGEAVELRLGVP